MPELESDRMARERRDQNERAAKDMRQRYKNTFSTPEGMRVLGDILTLGHFGLNIDPNDPVMVAELNFAQTIARTAGALDPLYRQLGIVPEEE